MPSPIESKRGVCIVAVGAKTAVGMTAPAAAAAVDAGIPGFAEHPFVIDRSGEPMIVASAPNLSSTHFGAERYVSLVIEPAREALNPLFRHRREIGAIPLYLGLPPNRPGRPPDIDQRIADRIKSDLQVDTSAVISTGHASGLMALESAARRVANGSVEFCLVGGVDSYLEPDTLEWLEANGQLHNGENPYGFIPGEAAGFCLLCLAKTAERRGLRPLAYVATAATSRETKLIKSDDVCLGKGLTEAFQKVFAELPSPAKKIESTVCDMNGEPYRADEYGFTIARLSQRFVDASAFVAPADCWGDVGAASGPLFVNLAIAGRNRSQVDAEYSLLWTSSESGERCAVILEQEVGAGSS
jgi:3-oxoacyl-[acyl-carrier-protein] synthase I